VTARHQRRRRNHGHTMSVEMAERTWCGMRCKPDRLGAGPEAKELGLSAREVPVVHGNWGGRRQRPGWHDSCRRESTQPPSTLRQSSDYGVLLENRTPMSAAPAVHRSCFVDVGWQKVVGMRHTD
jgi:hypothetical protein